MPFVTSSPEATKRQSLRLDRTKDLDGGGSQISGKMVRAQRMLQGAAKAGAGEGHGRPVRQKEPFGCYVGNAQGAPKMEARAGPWLGDGIVGDSLR